MKKRGQQFRRFLSILVILMLVWSSVPLTMPAYAATTEDGFIYEVHSSDAGDYVIITGYTGDRGAVTIPAQIAGVPIREIGQNAFAYNDNLFSVVFPEGLTTIGDYAFFLCGGLQELTLPGSVTDMGEYAFSNCESLQKITVSEGITSIGAYAFANSPCLTEVSLPDSLTTIGEGAFAICGSLQDIALPAGLTRLGGYAFFMCSSLKGLDLPAELNYLGEGALTNCDSLSRICVAEGNETFTAVDDVLFSADLTQLICCPAGHTGVYEVPAAVTEIGNRAFVGCKKLTEVILQEGVRNIGDYAFSTCVNLTSIEVAESNPFFASVDGVLFDADQTKLIRYPSGRVGAYMVPDMVIEIAPGAFGDAAGLTRITLPKGLTSINDDTFWNCTGLEEIVLPDGITSIGECAFQGCSNLKNVTMPQYLTSIGEMAFQSCTSLTAIIVPRGVNTLGYQTFIWCSSLQEVTLPASLINIEANTFAYCDNLHDVYFQGTEEQWEMIAKGNRNEPLLSANLHFLGNDHVEHEWNSGTVTKAPTEESEGEKTFTCTVCGETKTEVLPKLDHVHKYEAAVTAPTCTDKGYTTYTCPCGDSYTADEVPAVGHNFANGICSRCGEADPDYQEPEIPENPFSDVKETDYFLNPVLWAVEKGITSGTGNGQFSPNNTCTRGQVVTFLWRAMGQPEPEATGNPFSDVAETDYFYKPVLWAVQNGITSGTGGDKFSPNASCTRGQVVTFLWRAMGKPEPKTTENPFSDVKTADYFCEPVLWAVENQITSGTGGDQFSPNAFCTRGQVVTFLYRAFRNR